MNKDLISRQQAIEQVKELFSMGDCYCDEYAIIGMLNTIPSAHSEVIWCKNCIYQTKSWSGIKYCEAHGDHIGKDYDYCSNARRKTNGIL